MTGFSSLTNAVSGIQSQSDRISIASQNIANANTSGYKEARTTFANLIGGTIVNTQDTGGVTSKTTQLNDAQGDITPNSTPTNIAISGSGFFAVTTSASAAGEAASNGLAYTRNGSFTTNKNGDLVNNSGFFLQGYALNPDGTIPAGLQGSPDAGAAEGALVTVNIPQNDTSPVATSALTITANLNSSQPAYAGTPAYDPTNPAANMAGGVVVPQFSEPVTIVDSTGTAHDATVGFLKTGTNSWAVEVYANNPADVTGGNPQLASGAVTFNGDGTLASVSPSLTAPPSISWTTAGAAASTLNINWGTAGPVFGTPGATVVGKADGLEQLDETSASHGITNNGVQAGQLVGVSVNSDGFVVGSYSNGVSRNLYLVPVARFLDPTQLAAINDTTFAPTTETSAPEYVQPGTEESGTLKGSALEASSTSEDQDLTTLIISQQSYQFNSKLISTDDEMLQSLTQMVV